MEHLIQPIAAKLNITSLQITNTLQLLKEGNTVPFIARYRKEFTKGLDEEQILYISKEYEYQVNLDNRKIDVIRLIEQQGKITQEIIDNINNCKKLSEVEDIYRPYQQKKKTRASEAKRCGLEPLSEHILKHIGTNMLEQVASGFINSEIQTVQQAINGALDIIAEVISDNAKLRWKIKDNIFNFGLITSKLKKNAEDENKIFLMYYEYQEKINRVLPHRIMALERGESLKILSVNLDYDTNRYLKLALDDLMKSRISVYQELIIKAVDDGMKRLLLPSIEREIRSDLKQNGVTQSIDIFAMNVEKLIMQPPLKNKIILGLDPAYRTGCKLAIINEFGKVLDIQVIYPHKPVNKINEANNITLSMIKNYNVDIIAIGNGTASRESEKFVADLIKSNHLDISYTIVSEAGASVYSASELARKEFPDLTVEKRSAISIARRLQDPLAELIKIDPKSIGVGQYQHDLPKKELEEKLNFAISTSVNRVGADLNTASAQLLEHISGLTKQTAANIVSYRDENGKFTSRKQLSKVSKLGPKAINQAVGFLRIMDGKEILDQTCIHPESYSIANELLKLIDESNLGSDSLIKSLNTIDITEVSKTLNCDTFTLSDIIDALRAPLRDYREKYDGPLLKSDVLTLEDLHEKDLLQGVVRNVVDFGVFVDIGLKNDGLIHISKLSKQRVNHPKDICNIGDIVDVYVYNIDKERKKVQLSLIEWW